MSEISESIKFFIDLAAETGREVQYSEVPYPSNLIHRVVYHKRTVSMRMDETPNIWLISYHDPKEISETQSLYSGFFTPVNFPEASSLTIRKKYLLHRLRLIKLPKEILTLGSKFDKEVIITADPPEQHHLSFLHHQEMQQLVIQLFKLDERFIIGLNGVSIGFEPALSGKSRFGIFIPNDWINDRKKIMEAHTIFKKMVLRMGTICR